ncbi:AbrB/MazE/SpoVT family DNA-binding domain-containing protein [Thermaerobacter litoralis]
MRAVAVLRVQDRGQLTLPVPFRKAVGVKPGDLLMLILEARGPGHFEARVLSRRSLLDFLRIDAEAFRMGSSREEMERELAGDANNTP